MLWLFTTVADDRAILFQRDNERDHWSSRVEIETADHYYIKR